MINKGMIPPYLASFSVNSFKPEIKSLIKISKKNQNSIRMNALLLNGSIPVTPYSKMLTLKIIIDFLK